MNSYDEFLIYFRIQLHKYNNTTMAWEISDREKIFYISSVQRTVLNPNCQSTVELKTVSNRTQGQIERAVNPVVIFCRASWTKKK